MSRLIILEGPDECGKSTLAGNIARYFNGVSFHSTASKKLFPALEDYHRNILDNARENMSNGHVVVLDRFWPSEIAYGTKLFRPDSGYEAIAEQIHAEVVKENYLYVFCFSRHAWSRYKRGHTDPAHSLTEEQYRKVWKNYTEIYTVLKSLGANLIQYILEEDGMEEEQLTRFMQYVKELTKVAE
jgi:thymidylate kinase